MTQYEKSGSDEDIVPSENVFPDGCIEEASLDVNYISEEVLGLSASIEQIESVDFWKLSSLHPENITSIILGLANAKRSLKEVAELLTPPVVQDAPKPKKIDIPRANTANTTREDYGDSILPTGTQFLIDVPMVGQRMIEFGDKGVTIGNSKIRLGSHELYLLSLFLQNTQTVFTRLDIVNSGYHPRQPSISNRLSRLSDHLPDLSRKLARVFTGFAYLEGPIVSGHVGNQLAFTWIYPVKRIYTEENEITSIPTIVDSEPIEDKAEIANSVAVLTPEIPTELDVEVNEITSISNIVDTGPIEDKAEIVSSDTLITPEVPIELDSEVDDTIHSEPEAHPSMEAEVNKSQVSSRAELLFKNDNLFLNGRKVEVTAVEADIIRFMVVSGQSRSIKFEQLFIWLKTAHSRLSVGALNTVIDSLNNPLRFSGTGALVKTEFIENASGTRRMLTLGDNFTYRHLEDEEAQSLLDKFFTDSK